MGHLRSPTFEGLIMDKQKKQKKQKKIWVPAYDYDADGNIVVFGDAIVDADAASRFIGTPDEFEFIGTEDEVEVES